MSFDIWYSAVTSYLRSKGITEWCEGNVGGGYAIWGSPNVMQEIEAFNKQYLKSSIRHGVIPKLTHESTEGFLQISKKEEITHEK